MPENSDLSDSELGTKYEIITVPAFKRKRKLTEKLLNTHKPWLARDPTDPETPYCQACCSHLSCSSKVLRHSITPKHQSNLKAFLNKAPSKRKRDEESSVESDSSNSEYSSKFEETTASADYVNRRKLTQKVLFSYKPWLVRDALNPNIPYCKVCSCRISCSSKVSRHSRTPKHCSNLKIYLQSKKPQIKKETFENRKLNRSLSGSPNTKSDNASFNESIEDSITNSSDPLKTVCNSDQRKKQTRYQKKSKVKNSYSKSKHKKKGSPQESDDFERKNLLQKIHKDKHDLSTFNNLYFSHSAETKKKNHVGLFFDSVIESVKDFSPTLLAEMKLRVSQLVCELELRSINEKNTNTTCLPGAPNEAVLEISSCCNENNTFEITYSEVGSSQKDINAQSVPP